ncbi:MAG: DUF4907 domain-containing protein [bacterium]|nr:DUF4907 domain-containing protein [bacterium]
MRSIAFFALTFLLFSCSQEITDESKSSKPTKGKTMSETKNDWSYRAVETEGQGWGYQLYKGARMQIDQKIVPSVNGIHYFQSQEKAELAAELALEKVAMGYFPPTVEPQELDSIGAINLDSLLKINEVLMEKQ